MRVQHGQGWRLELDGRRQPYVVLLGGHDWTAEFTWQEATLIGQGLQRLLDQQQALADQLMPEEHLSLEWESGDIWLALEAAGGSCSLRFILTAAAGSRSLEAAWHGPACGAVAAALAAQVLGQKQPQRL